MIEYDVEYDVSKIAWEAYRLMYKDFFDNGKEEKNNNRPYLDYHFTHNSKKFSISLSGDTDFNFSNGFAHSRLETYKKFLENKIDYKKYKDMYSNNLEVFKLLNHSIVNVSLIPKTGNIQNIKQGIGNDRLDTFVWLLDLYYSKKICLFLNFSSYENIDFVKSYFDSFGTIYDYCEKIYHINESLVDDLINSGKKAIDSPERVIEFMNLTIRFWKQKALYLSEKATEEKSETIIKALNNYEQTISENLFLIS